MTDALYGIAKRSIDLSAAVTVLLLAWWLFIIIWLLIRRETPGPGIFAQRRIGQHGRVFTCYKFRTMKLDTPERATHLVEALAVTGVGRWLRWTKFDEMPQVWNILRNEISLVGPRPCLPIQTELIEARRVRGVLAIKPGITGLAQVNGIDMRDPVRLADWDARYLETRSLTVDLHIISATLCGSGHRDHGRA